MMQEDWSVETPREVVELQSMPEHRSEPVDDVTRAIPHALGPEKSVLSSMLNDSREYIARAIELGLTDEHFYLPSHAKLFALLVEMADKGQEVEFVSLVQRLIDRGQLDGIGGPSAITDIYTYAPSPGYFDSHVRHLRDKRLLRGIITISNESVAAAYDTPEEANELLDAMETKLMLLRGDQRAVSGLCSAKQGLESVIEELQMLMTGRPSTRGIKTGFEELDRMGGTLKPGEVFIVAARPSMGKTSFMMNIVEHVCVDQGVPSLVFSCEMTIHQIMSRLAYARAKFAMSQLTEGMTPNKGDLQRIQRAMVEIAAAKLFIDDTAGISISELRAKSRRKKRDEDIQFIAIDYVQLMKSNTKQSANSREREISEISAGIKGLAKELGLPILLLAQLNRGPEGRAGKQKGLPRMSDLRESGSLEQDGDMIGLLHRAGYYAEDEQEKDALAGQAKLILAKNRNGATGDVPLTFIADLMRFESGSPVQDQGEMFKTTQTPHQSRWHD